MWTSLNRVWGLKVECGQVLIEHEVLEVGHGQVQIECGVSEVGHGQARIEHGVSEIRSKIDVS